ncbi:DUF4442 domain-containing protein [Nonomuraea rhodomycinica]|uniref:DUF4442 domain-containing protein n=1 Tax=Nonomuraea rhodomycinica TaxID=1712872 RepID=A0A7Y6IVX1_9ACTN|nr:DUF4442 domain-containing protein [Nonomuraea rhodomycinica]NUW45066.1 DUF4442 domain-containing protein [Nonomuraea rhodomycinica]
MTLDAGALLLQTVPFARTLGVTFDHTGDGRAVCRLTDRADLHNHVAGPHAGALFTLAESASGAAMLSALGDQLARAVPLTTGATVQYHKLAKGDVVAEGRLLAAREDVIAELDAGKRPEFDVAVEVRNGEDVPVCSFTFTWTLRPNRT